jgi:dTDP-4-dehydrorhamnose reductase
MNKRVLILGASGMLGHKLAQRVSQDRETFCAVRKKCSHCQPFFESCRLIEGIEAESADSIAHAVEIAQPDVVVNCIGIVKQLDSVANRAHDISINSVLPHQLASLCESGEAKLIHISTDCVFSGKSGNYSERDIPDALDFYGRSKVLGEVNYANNLTLRTSFIGQQLHGSHGLLEWFLSNKNGVVRGYSKAIFSGLSSGALAEIITNVVLEQPELTGVLHVASEPISKLELLRQINEIFDLKIEIIPDSQLVIDRSLNGNLFKQLTGISVPGWSAMIEQLFADQANYESIKERTVC